MTASNAGRADSTNRVPTSLRVPSHRLKTYSQLSRLPGRRRARRMSLTTAIRNVVSKYDTVSATGHRYVSASVYGIGSSLSAGSGIQR